MPVRRKKHDLIALYSRRLNRVLSDTSTDNGSGRYLADRAPRLSLNAALKSSSKSTSSRMLAKSDTGANTSTCASAASGKELRDGYPQLSGRSIAS